MSSKVQQSVCSDCVTYTKSRIKFNTFHTFNNVKKTIKEFINRLRDAWSIIRGHNCVFILYEENTSEQEIFRTTSVFLGARWLGNNDNVNYFSRADMLFDLLNDTNSIMMLTKDADGTLTYCYDCKSEEDFDDLINMEVK